ncbi:hypothetical protein VQ643_09390 [Pseudomonas sp. F1_0610]|uniref:hypothetical protein n=1 Tax=Pseudomonas sp. F1_0610 TaxID=3114284 RepID=UPI0039C2C0F5
MYYFRKENKYTKSKKEKQFIEELLESKKNIYESVKGQKILSVITKKYGAPKAVYPISWFPSQGCEHYCLLIDGEYLVYLEVDNETQKVDDIEREKVTINQPGKSEKRNYIAVAIGLSKDEIAKLNIVDRGGVEKNKQ